MSPVVRPAQRTDIEPAAQLLHERMNPRIPVERWRRILDYPWRPDDAEHGWLVEDGGSIVGFMGTIYSDRQIGHRTVRVCDLSSWYLTRDYRGTGVGDELLEAGMARADVTYRTMTARRATGRKIRALGFSVLDATRHVFRPAGEGDRPLTVTRDLSDIRARLVSGDRQILDDHNGLGIDHAIVGDPGTWIVWQRKYKGDHIANFDVLYASDLAYLSAKAPGIATAIVDEATGVLAIDSRFMRPGDAVGEIETIPLARWYRSSELRPEEIDHLYSEVLLLDQKLP